MPDDSFEVKFSVFGVKGAGRLGAPAAILFGIVLLVLFVWLIIVLTG